MKTPGHVGFTTTARVLSCISLLCVSIFLYRQWHQPLAVPEAQQVPPKLPTSWTYYVQKISAFERYLIRLPYPFFEAIDASNSRKNQRLTQAVFFKRVGLDPSSQFPQLSSVRFASSNAFRPKQSRKALPLPRSLNQASVETLQQVRGIGPVLAKRVVSYRSYLGGFSVPQQCYEVYGLDSTVVDRLLQQFKILQPPRLRPADLDTISLAQLMKLPYVDAALAYSILAKRTEWGGFPIDSLQMLKGLDPTRIQRLTLYLK